MKVLLDNNYKSYDKIIFIDETGNENITGLEREGVSSYYVVGALVANSLQVESLENSFREIKQDNFQSEMKSSHIRKNLNRRLKILDEIFSVTGYSVDILIVEKSKLLKLTDFMPRGVFPSGGSLFFHETL